MRQLRILNHRGLTIRQNGRLAPDIRQPSNNHLIALDKTQQRVRNIDILAELLHELLRAPEVMSRDPRVQVVNSLELQAAVEEVEPLRAIDVHCRAQHALWEGLGDAEVCGGHCVV